MIGPDTTLSACTVGDGATVLRSHCDGATIGPGASVGPFTHLRPGADLAAGAKVGAYVEIKKSTIGPGAKVPHLSYIGDADDRRRAPTSAPARSPPTTTASPSPATVIGEARLRRHQRTLVAPVTLGRRRLRRRRFDGHRRRRGRAPWRWPAAGSTMSTGWVLARAGPAATPRSRRRGRRRRDRPAASVDTPRQHLTAPHTRPGKRPRERASRSPTRKSLMLFSGRGYPGAGRRGGQAPGRQRHPAVDLRLRQRRDLRPVRGVRPRLRRVPDPVLRRADQQLGDGDADHDRRAEAGVGQADHRGAAVLPVRPAGQEAPRPRADLGAAGRRPAQDRRGATG